MLIVTKLFFELFYFWLNGFHFSYGFITFICKRKKCELHNNSNGEDRETEISKQVVKKVDQAKHWASDKIEPTPIDEQVKSL